MKAPLVVVRFTPKPGSHEQVEAILRSMVAATRAEPGNRRYDLFRSTDGSGAALFNLVEHYADEAAAAAHRETAHYKQYRIDIMPLLVEPPQVQLLQAIDSKPY
ncbi:MAG: antibiotic biosynthesis monooxygenase [Proteobacteria bacterium]|nr:antibiotic biosynthesis monooxygenase [Pseudomonadota bacterium]